MDPSGHAHCWMGSDARGKRELPSEIFDHAKLFCDLPEQSIRIGQFQHVRERIEIGEFVLNAIGAVLEGRCPGRIARNDITVFDSSGIALQDPYIGQFLLSKSERTPNPE
jgi:ornithine cyclodeaminase